MTSNEPAFTKDVFDWFGSIHEGLNNLKRPDLDWSDMIALARTFQKDVKSLGSSSEVRVSPLVQCLARDLVQSVDTEAYGHVSSLEKTKPGKEYIDNTHFLSYLQEYCGLTYFVTFYRITDNGKSEPFQEMTGYWHRSALHPDHVPVRWNLQDLPRRIKKGSIFHRTFGPLVASVVVERIVQELSEHQVFQNFHAVLTKADQVKIRKAIDEGDFFNLQYVLDEKLETENLSADARQRIQMLQQHFTDSFDIHRSTFPNVSYADLVATIKASSLFFKRRGGRVAELYPARDDPIDRDIEKRVRDVRTAIDSGDKNEGLKLLDDLNRVLRRKLLHCKK